MNNENYSVPDQNQTGLKDKSIFGILFLIPVVIIFIVFLITPVITTIINSFMKINHTHGSELVGLKNFEMFFSDPRAAKCIINNVILVITAVPLTVGVSLFCAWLASTIHKTLRIILCIMFLMVSVTAIAPTGIHPIQISLRLFSTNNGSLLNWILMIMVSFLLGIGPLFLIFTVHFNNKDDIKKYFHIGLSLQIVICFLSFFSLKFFYTLGGIRKINLAEYAYDELIMSYNPGYGSAILIIMAILMILLFLLYNGLVWATGLISKNNQMRERQFLPDCTESRKNPTLSVVIFVILLITALLFLLPFLRIMVDSLKTPEELNPSTSFFTLHPTLDNYSTVLKQIGSGQSFWLYAINTLITLIVSTAALFFVSLIGSVGFALLGTRVKRLLTAFVLIIFILSPVSMLFFGYNPYSWQLGSSFGDNLLIVIVLKMIFRSVAFALSIFFSTKILENIFRKHNKPTDVMSSPSDIVKFLFGTLSVSAIASLAALLNPLNLASNQKLQTLYQIFLHYSVGNATEGITASLQVITMIIPIGVIIIFTPILMICLEQKKKPVNQ